MLTLTNLFWMFPGTSLIQRNLNPQSVLADRGFDPFEERPGENVDQWENRMIGEIKEASRAFRESKRNWEQALQGKDSTRQSKHYDWLVLFQVAKFSDNQIADKFAYEVRSYQRTLPSSDRKTILGESTVREAVRKLAKEIGLTPRPTRRPDSHKNVVPSSTH
ncbi:MAG: hypothetical protein KC643_30865 [Nitrospira sp.]|nr:hypothetical protein [Nitrospira sp.]